MRDFTDDDAGQVAAAAEFETELQAMMDETTDQREQLVLLTHLLLTGRIRRVQALADALAVMEERLLDPEYLESLNQRQLMRHYRGLSTVFKQQSKYMLDHGDLMDGGREEAMVAWFRQHEMGEDQLVSPSPSGASDEVPSPPPPSRKVAESPGASRSNRISGGKAPERPLPLRVAEETQRVDLRELARSGAFRVGSECPSTLVLSSGLEVAWELHKGMGDRVYLHLRFLDSRPLPSPALALSITKRRRGKRVAVLCPALVEDATGARLCRRPSEILYLVHRPDGEWGLLCRRCAQITYRAQRLRGTFRERFDHDPAALDVAMQESIEAAQVELLTGERMPPRAAQQHRAVMAAVGWGEA